MLQSATNRLLYHDSVAVEDPTRPLLQLSNAKRPATDLLEAYLNGIGLHLPLLDSGLLWFVDCPREIIPYRHDIRDERTGFCYGDIELPGFDEFLWAVSTAIFPLPTNGPAFRISPDPRVALDQIAFVAQAPDRLQIHLPPGDFAVYIRYLLGEEESREESALVEEALLSVSAPRLVDIDPADIVSIADDQEIRHL